MTDIEIFLGRRAKCENYNRNILVIFVNIIYKYIMEPSFIRFKICL